MVVCGFCGGVVAPDGRCWECGGAQPGFRARVEVTAGAAAGVSDRGLRREVNADAVALAACDGWTVGVACDGVSMSPRAERAAQVAAESGVAELTARLAAGALPEEALERAVGRAARAVAALASSVNAAPACTFVAGVVGGGGLWCGWVGDSRAYWVPGSGAGMVLTEDDHGEHGALAAWLGADAGDVVPRVRSYRPQGEGCLVLCTDGLSRYLDGLPRLVGGGDALARARALVAHALDCGGADNVTALVMPLR